MGPDCRWGNKSGVLKEFARRAGKTSTGLNPALQSAASRLRRIKRVAARVKRMTVKLIACSIASMLIAGCAHEPTAIERTMVSPSAQGSRPAGSIPAVAATSSFDDVDQATMIQHFNHTMESAPTGQPITWTNPSGVNVQLSATRTFQQADGTYCREFTQSIGSGGQSSVAKGTACRQSDGTWQIIS